jgi:hypothetical protein
MCPAHQCSAPGRNIGAATGPYAIDALHMEAGDGMGMIRDHVITDG